MLSRKSNPRVRKLTFKSSSLYGGTGAYILKTSAKQQAANDRTSLSLWLSMKGVAIEAAKSL